MNITPTSSKSRVVNNQPSILGFVDTPNFETAKNRAPRPERRNKETQHYRGSSSNSTSRKRRLSPDLSMEGSKRLIMEDETSSFTTPAPSSPTSKTSDPFTVALREMEERLTNNMKNMLDPMREDISSLVLSQKEWERHKTDVQDLKVEKTRLNHKIKEVEEKNTKLEDRVRKLEDKLLESNLMLHGITEAKWELDSTRNDLVIQAIANTVSAATDSEKIDVAKKIPISSTARIGKFNPSRSRPIRVCFASKSDADLLMERKKKLKQGVYVDREYNDEEEAERKLLRPILRAARKQTHYRGKCKMDGTKLIIKGKSYTRSNLETLPEDISAAKISSKEDDNTIGFFGELSPLSNFHPNKFMYAGIEYKSSEQLIQHQKAKLFRDIPTAEKIMAAKTPLECKKFSCEITNYDHEKWKSEACIHCEEGIKAKFMQNSGIRSYLLNTGSKRLVKCCNDRLWGNGVPLHEEKCLSPSHWHAQGILGEILENTRSNIRDIMGINRNTHTPASPPQSCMDTTETSSNVTSPT